MPRIKRGVVAKRKHKKVLNQAKGYYGANSRVFRVAKQAVIKAAQYAYRDRKQRKRVMRALWIMRINAGVRKFDLSYSKFIYGMNKLGLDLNRKMLAELAVRDEKAFAEIVAKVKEAL